MRIEHVKWAKQHDWYINCVKLDQESELLGHDEYAVIVRGDIDEDYTLRFDSVLSLRTWAGY